MVAAAGTIRLNTGTIDTSQAPPLTAQGLKVASSESGEALALVQFQDPNQSHWLDGLRKAGIEPHFYVPDFAYLVTLTSAQLNTVHAARGVSWVGALPETLKVHPRLPQPGKHAAPGAPKEGDNLAITILSVNEEPAAWLKAKGLPAQQQHKAQLGWYDTRTEVPEKMLADLAGIWSVFYIEPAPTYELHGERGAQTAAGNFAPGASAPLGPDYTAWLAS